MTDSKALIERLRPTHLIVDQWLQTMNEAADHIEKLEADNARLREALDWMEYSEPGVVEAIRMRVARAALQGTSHD